MVCESVRAQNYLAFRAFTLNVCYEQLNSESKHNTPKLVNAHEGFFNANVYKTGALKWLCC